MHSKVELMMVVHVNSTVTGTDETCSYVALGPKLPTNILAEMTWNTGCAFKRDWGLRTLEIT